MKEELKPTICAADDHPLLLRGLTEFLAGKGYEVIGESHDGESALQSIRELRPDVAILDIEMPIITGIEIARECKKLNLPTRIILLSYHKDPFYKAQAKSLNIQGYLLKEDALNHIEECIRYVCNGELYLSNSLREINTESSQTLLDAIESLTPSELKILRIISEGKDNNEIASTLFISVRTIEKHRSNIIAKLGIEGKSKALNSWAIEHKKHIH